MNCHPTISYACSGLPARTAGEHHFDHGRSNSACPSRKGNRSAQPEPSMTTATTSPSNFRLCAVSLDGSFGRQTDKDQKREQAVTIFDLLDNKALHPLVTTVDPIGCALPWPTGGWSCESPPRTEPVLCHHCRSPRSAGCLGITALSATATRMRWPARCPRGSRPWTWDAGPFTTRHQSSSENASDQGSMSIWRPPVGRVPKGCVARRSMYNWCTPIR